MKWALLKVSKISKCFVHVKKFFWNAVIFELPCLYDCKSNKKAYETYIDYSRDFTFT
jgi:hypothetical protein